MKKFFKSMLIAAGLILAALLVFVATFNIDRYKPMIIDATEKSLGVAVDLGRLSLSLRNGLSVEARDFAAYADKSKKEPARLKLEKASISLELMPLLHKDIRVTAILLKNPFVVIVKEKDGSLNVGGVKLAASEKPSVSQTPAGNSQSSVFIPLTIRRIEIQGAKIIFRDESGPAESVFEADGIDVLVKDFSFVQTFAFQAKAAIFSAAQNIRVEGKARLPQGQKPGFLHGVVITTDLKDLDTQKLSAQYPGFAAAGIGENGLSGAFEMAIDHFEIGASDLANSQVSLTLKNGRIALKSAKAPVENVDIQAALSGDDLKLDHATANFAGGTVQISGIIHHLKAQPALELRTVMKDLELDRMLQAAAANAPRLSGHLSLEMNGNASGMTWPKISKTLNGNGHIVLKDGVLLNFNLLREVVQKLSIVPGAEIILQNNFPMAYKASLAENNTLLKPVDLTAAIQNGVFIFNTVVIQTDLIAIGGAGTAGLDGDIHINAGLSVAAPLSAELVSVLNPLQILLNDQQQLFMPLSIEGKLPEVRALPDKQYLVSKLLGGQAGDLLKNLVEPKDGKNKIDSFLSKLKGSQPAQN